MNEQLINILKHYPTSIENEQIYVKLPIVELLDLMNNLSMQIAVNADKCKASVEYTPKEHIPTPPPIIKKENTIFIPKEVKDLYNNNEKLLKDVKDFLKVVSDCWGYHDLGYARSILKKACGRGVEINKFLYSKIQKDADAYLELIIKNNEDIIKSYWNGIENGNKKG